MTEVASGTVAVLPLPAPHVTAAAAPIALSAEGWGEGGWGLDHWGAVVPSLISAPAPTGSLAVITITED